MNAAFKRGCGNASALFYFRNHEIHETRPVDFPLFVWFVYFVVKLIWKMELNQLAQILAALGCPAEKCADMAAQLDKRARQLAAEKGRPYDEALAHLLDQMKQGWAAQNKTS